MAQPPVNDPWARRYVILIIRSGLFWIGRVANLICGSWMSHQRYFLLHETASLPWRAVVVTSWALRICLSVALEKTVFLQLDGNQFFEYNLATDLSCLMALYIKGSHDFNNYSGLYLTAERHGATRAHSHGSTVLKARFLVSVSLSSRSLRSIFMNTSPPRIRMATIRL
jgi:hypothetical protein